MDLFHITTREAWERALTGGEYRAPSLETAGFIHLSLARQWQGARRRFYVGVSDLVLLTVDAGKLTAEVRFERVDGDDFPHLYGPLNLDAVSEVRELGEGAP